MKRIGFTGALALAPAPALALTLALALGAACSDDDVTQVCGNGAIEGTELCDMDQTGSADCVSQGFAGGTLTCNSSCDGFDTTLCTSADCGNGAIDTPEECDDTNLDGNDCASVGNYVGGTLACATDCTFDTSNCTPPPNCGNGAIDTPEECDDTNLDGNDCTSVGNYVGGTLACATDCTFDTSSCTPPPDCGNGAIDANEDCDASNLDGNDCASVGGGFAGGTLACENDCTFDTGGCLTASETIAAARATADGTTTSLSINAAWVTYIRDGYGTDPMGGFHVQVEQLGPALFVQADATTLGALTVGDEVTFDILEMDTVYTLRQAVAIANLTIGSSGHDVTTLYQNVSDATDLVTALDDYESEVLTLDATVTSSFGGAGPGYEKAEIETDAIPSDGTLFVRIPTSVLAGLNLAPGCQITATGVPMWRYDTEAQVGTWDAADLTVNTCPAPEVTGAAAVNAVDVDVTFSASIDVASLTSVPTQITFDQGVSAVSAVVNGSVVTVTTDGLASGITYTVTVANTVTDLVGTGVLPTANSATFVSPVVSEIDCADGLDEDADGYPDCLDTDCTLDAACAFGAQLYIWELDSDQAGGDTQEFVEIWNNTGGPVDLAAAGVFLVFVNGSDDLIDNVIPLAGTVNDGEVFVVGMAAVPNVDQTFTAFLQNDQEGVMVVSCTSCNTSDFPDNHDPTPSGGTFTTFNGRTATVIDALAYHTNDTIDASLMAALGVTAQHDEGETHPISLIRTSLAGFAQAVPDPGNVGFQP